MKIVKLKRLWEDYNQTTGILYVLNSNGQPIYASSSIERGDRCNEKNVSNIPKGIYPLVFEYSPKFDCFLYEIKNVPNRSECKIHPASYWKNLKGCIALGELNNKDMNNDGYFDLTNSNETVKKFHKAMGGLIETTIEIF